MGSVLQKVCMHVHMIREVLVTKGGACVPREVRLCTKGNA
jgi:hypothetical protein